MLDARRVLEIYVSPSAGAPMLARSRVAALAGQGLAGDRYANGNGYWSYEPRYVSEVTFIEREAIERVARELGRPFTPIESRRNIVTVNVRLQELIGRRFRIGTAIFEGVRPCEPCRYLDRLIGKPVRALLGVDGGLRAVIVYGGEIAIGDRVDVLPD
jgi:MOSC domain-containing protein YiiM